MTVETGKCSDAVDNDCDGKVDSADTDCTTPQVCVPNSSEDCTYFCSVANQNIPGRRTCKSDGSGWGSCEKKYNSESGLCTNAVDDDCDGKIDSSDTDCQGATCAGISTKVRVRLMSGKASTSYLLCGDAEGLNSSCSSIMWACLQKQADSTGYIEWLVPSTLGCDLYHIWEGVVDANGVPAPGSTPLVQGVGNNVQFAQNYSWANFEFARVDANQTVTLMTELGYDSGTKTLAVGNVAIARAGQATAYPNFAMAASATCAINP
jgi:hypothetical protein